MTRAIWVGAAVLAAGALAALFVPGRLAQRKQATAPALAQVEAAA